MFDALVFVEFKLLAYWTELEFVVLIERDFTADFTVLFTSFNEALDLLRGDVKETFVLLMVDF